MSNILNAELRHRFSVPAAESLWRGEKPTAVIFATSSVRKALVFHWVLHNFNFDLEEMGITIKGPGLDGVTNPEELQQYFSQYVYNGDMQLKHKVYLGSFEGVPFFACPQEGETENNEEPVEEAKNKLLGLAKEFEGQQVYIISSDVVGSSSTYTGPGDLIKLGKPVNFKRTAEASWDEVPWQDLETFVAWYKETVLTVGATLEHISGLVTFSVLEQEMRTQQIRLVQTLTQEVAEQMQVLLDAGLGGAWQQLQVLLDDELTLLGEAVTEVLPEGTEDTATIEQLTYAHMVGVQALALLTLVIGQQRDLSEVVIFQQQESN